MKKSGILILSLAVLLSASSSFAYVSQGQFTLSPQVGGYTFDQKQHLKTYPVYGVRLGYNFSDNIGVEGGIDYAFTKSTPTWYGKKVDFFKMNADLLYHFMPDSKIVPYVAVGGGAYSFYGPSYIVSKDVKGLLDYGAGLKLYMSDKYAVRADARHVIAASGTENFYNNFQYTLGILVSFGGSKPAAKPVNAAVQPAATPAAVASCPPCPEPVLTAGQDTPPVATASPKIAQEQMQTTQPAAPPASPVIVPAASISSTAVAATAPLVIRDVVVGSNYIEIQGDRPLDAFLLYSLSKPLRQVIDFPGATTDISQKTISVNRFGITSAKIAADRAQVRITFGTKQSKFPRYWVEAKGNSLKILFVSVKAPAKKAKPSAAAAAKKK